MKRFRFFNLIIAWVLLFGIWCLSFAQEAGCELSFLDIGAGARARALGNAFVGIANDANAVFWNPSGIVSLDGPMITGMHSSLFFGTKFDYLAVAAPLTRIYTDNDTDGYRYGIGIAYIRASTGDIPLTQQGSDTIPGTNYPEIVYNGTAEFTSNTGIIGIALRLSKFSLALSPGINYLKLANFTGFGFNFGFASLITLINADDGADTRGNTFKIGITLQDLLPLKLKWSNGFEEKVLPAGNLGCSFEFRKKILFAGVLNQTLASGHHPGYGLGLEWKPVSVLPIRFGMEDKNFSTGAGFLSRRISLDYTIYIHQELPLSHYLSVGIRL